MFPQRIMVVDDDPIVLSIAKAFFIGQGVKTCDLASNGEEAMQLFKQCDGRYDFILCDISMPRLDDIQLTATLAMAKYAGWVGIISSQHPTLYRTALNITESYGMRTAGIAHKAA